MAREYDKLVRDDVPEIIEADGEQPVTHTAEGEEYTERLVDKLAEEVAEYRESRDIEELADVLEVVHTLREDHEVPAPRFEAIRAQKAAERGRFHDGIVLERVEE